VVALALGAGCGGVPVSVAGSTVRLRVGEYHITPQDVRVRGPVVRIVMTDDGRLAHNIKVFRAPLPDAVTPSPVGGTPTAHPGETVHATLRLRSGRYELADSLANDRVLGVNGTLTVQG
jgi:hypothetical protein